MPSEDTVTPPAGQTGRSSGPTGTTTAMSADSAPQQGSAVQGQVSPSPSSGPTTGSVAAARPGLVGAASQAPAAQGPVGPPGKWTMVFDDEFNGSTLDRSRWSDMDGRSMNNVTTLASNVSVSGGNLILTLSSTSDGAFVSSAPSDGAGANGFLLQTGDYAEARIYFPGDGNRVYNWPAWWASGPDWPAAGEHDIAEVLSGDLTVNYHSLSGTHNQGTLPGYWGNAYHVYGLHLLANRADVYWDGVLVKSYPTDDNGQGKSLLLNVGHSSNPVTGAASQVKVDWVRAYRPS